MAKKTTSSDSKPSKSSKRIHLPAISKPAAGAATGAVVGAVAGPVGAVVGGVIGAVLGRRAQKGKSLLPSLGRSRKTSAPSKSAKKTTGKKTAAKKTAQPKSAPGRSKKRSASSARRGKAGAKA